MFANCQKLSNSKSIERGSNILQDWKSKIIIYPIEMDFRFSWRRAADSCAARRGCAEAEAQQRRPSNVSIGGEGVHRRAPSWRGPQARRMASFRFRSAPAPHPRPRRRMPANRHPAIAIVWLCSAARELAKRPL